MNRIEKLKQSAIKNIITSEFEIKEGLKIAFEEGYKEGRKKLKEKLKKNIVRFIEKKSIDAGNLPDKYDCYQGGNSYAQLMDIEDVLKVLNMLGIEFTEEDEYKFT